MTRSLATLALLPLALALAVAPAGPLHGQTGSGSSGDAAADVARANRALQTGDPAGAAAILEEVTSREPDHAGAWSLLGSARLRSGEVEGAVEALERALSLEDAPPTALYTLGLAHLQAGDEAEGFRRLQEAKATGRVNMTNLDLSPATEDVRDDPRYRALFPTEAEYADPFVEDVEIIREWRGESAGDQFGWIARNAGDVDGDGVADVLTSAPTWGENAGKIYLYSSGTGELLWAFEGEPGERLGIGVEAAGDAGQGTAGRSAAVGAEPRGRDGVPDVVAGGPGGDRAVVLDGRDGSVLHELRPAAEGELFGRKVSDAGDVDGDGHGDVLVGAPMADAAGEDAGRAYLFSGRTGEVLHVFEGEAAGDQMGNAVAGAVRGGRPWLVVGASNAGPNGGGRVYVFDGMDDAPRFTIDSDEGGAQLGGMFVSVVGDVDGDGVPDVYGSDWAHGALGPATGRIYVHSGATGERLHTLTGEAAGDGFGIGTADVGDLDGDGLDDLGIGAWQHAGAAPSGGKLYVHSGDDGRLLWSVTGKVPGETFAFDVTGMGDVDGDGTPDLLVTSAWSAVNGARSGRMFILSGRPPS